MSRQKVVLIADDDAELVNALTMRCRTLGLDVKTAYNAQEALNCVHEFQPDLICLDLKMPAGNGLAVCEMLMSGEPSSIVPIILMTGETDDETVRRCHNLCVYYIQKCPDLWARIEPLLCELMDVSLPPITPTLTSDAPKNPPESKKMSAILSLPTSLMENSLPAAFGTRGGLLDVVFEMLGADPKALLDDRRTSKASDAPFENLPPWVLCIDDDAEFSMALKLRLETHGVAVVRAFEGMEGLRRAFTYPADVILLDYEMPNGQGDYILGRLKDNPATRDLPVIIITGRKDRMLERRMLSLGAAKFMTKPPNFPELLSELSKHISIVS